ncbi:MAG: hypothetical protein SWH68_14560 [Thermodesulfobacteriota bacterium]|nr:hypothetical protein [Thermodesulfobacteriota bacterium]
MQTQLLIIKCKDGKCKDGYIRIKDGHYTVCGMEKASVYPMSAKICVEGYCQWLKSLGIEDIRIKKLTITEEALT